MMALTITMPATWWVVAVFVLVCFGILLAVVVPDINVRTVPKAPKRYKKKRRR